jgi:putative protease
MSELNRLRRELVEQLISSGCVESAAPQPIEPRLSELLAAIGHNPQPELRSASSNATPGLIALCRSLPQLEMALESGLGTVYVDFEDIRRYREAVDLVRQEKKASIFLATPRIQKAGEQGFFKLIENAGPDGVLIRNLGALSYFQSSPLRKVGDFSLNVANPLTAAVLMKESLEHLTISYDLNVEQVLSLLHQAPPDWFELTLHQHMPMFHMEHCVFAAFLSEGTDHTNCGRPCDRHQIKLRDRVGAEHPVKADVGCRNTVFHQKAQSGADYYQAFIQAGLRRFRIEFLNEEASKARSVLETYRALMQNKINAEELVSRLQVQNQLGVTSGTLTVLGG